MYTRSLVESQMSKTLSLDPVVDEEEMLPDADDEVGKMETILTVSNTHFPTVCTFDQFLKYLDNTIR